MSAATTDKLDRVTDSTTGRPVLAQLVTPGKAIGASSITCNNLTNWTTTTKIHFSIYNLTSAGVKDPTTQTDWTGIVSGNTITNLTLTGGTDQAYNPGAIVDPTPTAGWAKDLYDNITGHANQDGSLKTSAVQAALNLGNSPSAGWTPIGATPSYSANNGNKEFVVTFPIDLTTTVQRGHRIQFTRGTTPPTQCMAFAAASSQYASKSSPSGITFTTAYTCEAWIYLNSSSATGGIISRYDGTNGFILTVTSGGAIALYAGASTNATVLGNLPLKQWVHVAATFSSGIFNIYVNGQAVNYAKTGSATTITQAGNLQVGGYNSLNYFDGYIAEARVWSVAQTQANIQANMAISLTGSETNLVALFQGNGNFNDKTTSANNLTATNGAVATQTFSTINGGTSNEPTAAPMNAVEIGIITDVSTFTGGNTSLKIFTGTDYNIPNGSLSAPQYSIQKAPFGFPTDPTKWTVSVTDASTQTQNNFTNGTWYNVGSHSISIPTGSWKVQVQDASSAFTGAANKNSSDLFVALSTSASSVSDVDLFTSMTVYVSVTNTGVLATAPINLTKDITVTSATTYYYILSSDTSSATSSYLKTNHTGNGSTKLRAVCAYL